MNISALFIRRPVMTTLVMASILLFGCLAYSKLPVSDLPTVDFPTIQVTGSLPGASPETMASSVATVLERQFSTIAGLDNMSSTSSLGTSQVTLQFSLSRDIDAAAQDVQSAIAKVTGRLPQNMPNPPTYQKVNPADQPILFLAVRSSVLPLPAVNEYADTMIAQRLSMVEGVAQVQVLSPQKHAIRVQVDPSSLAARDVGIDEVARAVSGANSNLPNGIVDGRGQAYTIEARGQIDTAGEYRDVVVAYREGVPLRLGDLGRVIESVENTKAAGWFNGERAILINVQRQPGSNTVAIVDRIMGLLPAINAQLPPSVEVEVLSDRSVTIRRSVEDVKLTLILSVVLVVVVIFVFLRSVRATLIPGLAVPLSIVGTFCAMYLFDYSLNNLSLMALTLSVGFVVDDAIVMLENIVRHAEKGEADPVRAALEGSRQVGFTILSMTLSLAAVFFPVFFMSGVVGRLLHEFAGTITIAILISGFVSLSLTPMMCSRFLGGSLARPRGFLFRITERMFDGIRDMYAWTLRLALKLGVLVLLGSFALAYATWHVGGLVPRGFIPNEDTGMLFGSTEAAQGISYDSMLAHQQRVAAIVAGHPDVEAFMSSLGGNNNSGTNTGRLFLRLRDRPGRTKTDVQIVQELRKEFSGIPGITVFLQQLPPIRLGGQLSKSQYQYTLSSGDTDVLFKAGADLEAKLRDVPLLQDVTSNIQIKNPQVVVDIDRDKAAILGLSATQIETALYTAYGSREVTTIQAPTDQYKVILEVDPKYQREPEALELLHVRSSNGSLVPLSTVASLRPGVGPLSITHQGQMPSVTLSFNLAPGASLGDATVKVEGLARQTLPAGIITSFQGTAQAFQDSTRGLALLLVVAILVIYIVLGVLYESFIHPLTILSGLPSAGLGALLTLKLFGMELNLYSFVGIMLLVGIVKKNAIMMIDFALEAQREGSLPPREAIYQGCIVRFRPIMMTTAAALVGTLPIALGLGTSGEARRPLGMAVVGGLVVSQLVTLYITPVYYLFFEWLLSGWRSLLRRPAGAPKLVLDGPPMGGEAGTG